MGKVINFPPEKARHNRIWNEGYSDGYHGKTAQVGKPDPYYTAYEVGKDDREEDSEAIESGDFDLLTEEERKEVYGDERDQI